MGIRQVKGDKFLRCAVHDNSHTMGGALILPVWRTNHRLGWFKPEGNSSMMKLTVIYAS